MTKKRRKAVSFDAMVKFFIRNYEIPTKADVERINARLDRIETLIRRSAGQKTRGTAGTKKRRPANTASENVYRIIKRSRKGLKFADIKLKTDYDDKKLRNIIFRLHSLGRIKRVSRGVYMAV